MQIVIDIPEEVYNSIKSNEEIITYITKDGGGSAGLQGSLAIINGTPLPKGHGRLIDADALYDSAPLCHTEEDGTACVEWREINDAPTIIEVEESDSE